MISIPVSIALAFVLKLLGVHLSVGQSAMVIGGTILVVKVAVALGAYTGVSKLWDWFNGRKAAQTATESATSETPQA